jgi:hypothetical protein
MYFSWRGAGAGLEEGISKYEHRIEISLAQRRGR